MLLKGDSRTRPAGLLASRQRRLTRWPATPVPRLWPHTTTRLLSPPHPATTQSYTALAGCEAEDAEAEWAGVT